MRQWDEEAFVPVRVSGVGDDSRPCDGGVGDRDGDVRVTGDNLAAVVQELVAGLMQYLIVIGVGDRDLVPGRRGFAGLTWSKATAYMAGD